MGHTPEMCRFFLLFLEIPYGLLKSVCLYKSAPLTIFIQRPILLHKIPNFRKNFSKNNRPPNELLPVK